jgi:hypothetical protein
MPKKVSGKSEVVRILTKSDMATSKTRQNKQAVTFATDYLVFFGYLTVELLKSVSMDDIHAGIKVFQRYFGIKADGMLTEETLRAMQVPRCGCPDKLDKSNGKHVEFLRAAEVAAERRDRWNKTGLTYFVADYVGGKIPKSEQRRIFQEAFKAWDDVCGLDISESKDVETTDIVITTGKGLQHQFDGKGGTLAWAYMPRGDNEKLLMRFDLEETWVANKGERGILLSNVACHEFGHLLGLLHSDKNQALMAPYYNPFVGTPQSVDDISRIQKLYGPNQNPEKLKSNIVQTKNTIEVKLQPGQKLIVTN